MKKSYLALLSILAVCLMLGNTAAFAQDDAAPAKSSNWTFQSNNALTFSQVALKNWAAGGQNSISGEINSFSALEYKREKLLWNTTLNLGFGLTKQGNEPLAKTLDVIDLASQFGYKAYKAWYYSVMLGLKTQFTKGYAPDHTTLLSDFMAPFTGILSIGMSYQPDEHLNVLLSPLTGRMVYVQVPSLAKAGAYGVDPKTGTLWECGGYLKATYRNTFFKNDMLGLNTSLQLFSNYLKNPQNIDVNFDVMLEFKLLSYLTARIQLTLIYDDDQKFMINGQNIPALQIREMFGLGLSYNFTTAPKKKK